MSGSTCIGAALCARAGDDTTAAIGVKEDMVIF